MHKRWLAIIAGLLTAVCLLGGAFLALQRIQTLVHPPTPQPIDRLRLFAHNSACLPPEHIVPGSYQVDPPQTVGDWLVLTYTVVCQSDAPDTPGRQAYSDYQAENSQGAHCGGGTSMEILPLSATTTGPAAIRVESMQRCPAPKGQSGLSVVTGYLTGRGSATAQVLFGAGVTASAPLRDGHFVVIAPTEASVCIVRALDAAGAVLAELKLKQVGATQPPGACL